MEVEKKEWKPVDTGNPRKNLLTSVEEWLIRRKQRRRKYAK